MTELECQYGCGKFRIDIVIKERGKNLLAIECDGAAYHSSLVARTRDRARQRILENRGWRGRIHRVWSTNWWHFEAQEKQAILAAISSARQAQKGLSSRAQSVQHVPPASASTPAHDPQEDEGLERANLEVDDAGNVREKEYRKPNMHDPQPGSAPIADKNTVQQTSSAALGVRRMKSSQPQFRLETPIIIGGVRFTASELINTLFDFIPAEGETAREDLLEEASRRMGVPIESARAELNRLINEERSFGRLHVTPGSWENVWRA